MAGRQRPSNLLSAVNASTLCRGHPRLTSLPTVRLLATPCNPSAADFAVRHLTTETNSTSSVSSAAAKRRGGASADSAARNNVRAGADADTECSALVGVTHDRRRNTWSCQIRVDGKVARLTASSSTAASVLSDLWRIAVRGPPESWTSSSSKTLNQPDHPAVQQALLLARSKGKPQGMTHAKALEVGLSLLQQAEATPTSAPAPLPTPNATTATPSVTASSTSHKRARSQPAGVMDLEPWMGDDLLEFLDVFALTSCKSRVEAQLLQDCLRAESGLPLRKEAHGMEWGLRQPAKHSPRVLDLGLSTRLLAAYGADARVAPHKHGMFRVDRSDPLQWLQAVRAASPSLRLAEMEAQLLDLRVCHSFLHPQHTEDAWQLPIHLNKPRLAAPEPRNARTRAELSAVEALLARFPEPQPLTKGSTYVSMSQSLLARFNVTESTHPVLWAKLKLYARVHAYILALVLNRQVVLYWGEQLRLWEIARLNPHASNAAASPEGSAAHDSPSHAGDVLGDDVPPARATSTRRRMSQLKSMTSPPHSTGRADETPFPLLCPSMPQGVTRYLTQVRRVLMSAKLLEPGVLPNSSGAAPWWAARLASEMPDVDSARTGLLALPPSPLSSRVAPVYGPLLAAYLGDSETARQAVTQSLPLTTACVVETAQYVLMTSGAQATAGSAQARTAEALQSLIRDGARATREESSTLVPGMVPAKADARACAVYDPLQVLPSVHTALGLPQEVLEGMRPPAVLKAMSEAVRSQPAADYYRVIEGYRTLVRGSLQAVRQAPGQVRIQVKGASTGGSAAVSSRDHLRRQLEAEQERQKTVKEKNMPHYPLLDALLQELRAIAQRDPKAHKGLLQLAQGMEAEGMKQLRESLTAQFGRWWSEDAAEPAQLESSVSHKLATSSLAAGGKASKTGKKKTFGPASEVEQLLELRNKYHAVRLYEESARVHVHTLMGMLPQWRLALLYKPICMGALAYLRPRHLLDDPVLGPMMAKVAVSMQQPAVAEGSAAPGNGGHTDTAPPPSSTSTSTPGGKKPSILARLKAFSTPSIMLSQWSQMTNEALLLSRVLTSDTAPLAQRLPGFAVATAPGLGLDTALPKVLREKSMSMQSAPSAATSMATSSASASEPASVDFAVAGADGTALGDQYKLDVLYGDVIATVARLEKLQQLPWDIQESAAGFVPAFMPNYWAEQEGGGTPGEVLDPRARVLGWVMRVAFLLTEKDFMYLRNQVAYLTQCLGSKASGNEEIAKPGTTPFVTSFPGHPRDGSGKVTLAVGMPLNAPISGMPGGPTFQKALKDACSAFGPLGYLLDDPFLHLLKRGWLTAGTFDAARLLILRQYATTAMQTRYWMGVEKSQRAKYVAQQVSATGGTADVERGGSDSEGGVPESASSDSGETGLLADEAAEQGNTSGDMTDNEAVHALGDVPSLPALHVLQTLSSVTGLAERAAASSRAEADHMQGTEEEVTAGSEGNPLSEQERAELEAYAAEVRSLESHLLKSKVEHELPGADISWTREETPWRIPRIRANMDRICTPVDKSGKPIELPVLHPDTYKQRNLTMPLAVFQRTIRSVAMPVRLRAERRRRHYVRVKADGTPQSFEYNTLPDVVARTVFLQKLPMIGVEVPKVSPGEKFSSGKGKGASSQDAFTEPSQMLDDFILDVSDHEEEEEEEERMVSLGRSTGTLEPHSSVREAPAVTGSQPMLPIGKFITAGTVYNVLNSIGPVEDVQVHWARSRSHLLSLKEWMARKADVSSSSSHVASTGTGSQAGMGSRRTHGSEQMPWMIAPSAEELQNVKERLEALAASERLMIDSAEGEGEAAGTQETADREQSWEELRDRADALTENEGLDSSVSSLFGLEDSPEDIEDGVLRVLDDGEEGQEHEEQEDARLPAVNGATWNGTGQAHLLNGTLNGHRNGSARPYSTLSSSRLAVFAGGSVLPISATRHSLLPHVSLLASMAAQARTMNVTALRGTVRVASTSSSQPDGPSAGGKGGKGARSKAGSQKTAEQEEPKLRRSQLLQRLRRFNQASDLHAFVRFRTDEPMAVVTSESIRHFGLSVGGQSVTVVPAAEVRALYVTGLPEGLTHDAACVLLHDMLEKWGLKGILDHKNLDRGRTGSLPTVYRHNVLLNAAGEAVVLLDTHQDAVRAAALLRRACLPVSSSSISALGHGVTSSAAADTSAAGGTGKDAKGGKEGRRNGRKVGSATALSAAVVTSSGAVDVEEEDGPAASMQGMVGGVDEGEVWDTTTPPGRLTVGWATLDEAKLRGMSRPERYLPSTR